MPKHELFSVLGAVLGEVAHPPAADQQRYPRWLEPKTLLTPPDVRLPLVVVVVVVVVVVYFGGEAVAGDMSQRVCYFLRDAFAGSDRAVHVAVPDGRGFRAGPVDVADRCA